MRRIPEKPVKDLHEVNQKIIRKILKDFIHQKWDELKKHGSQERILKALIALIDKGYLKLWTSPGLEPGVEFGIAIYMEETNEYEPMPGDVIV